MPNSILPGDRTRKNWKYFKMAAKSKMAAKCGHLGFGGHFEVFPVISHSVTGQDSFGHALNPQYAKFHILGIRINMT